MYSLENTKQFWIAAAVALGTVLLGGCSGGGSGALAPNPNAPPPQPAQPQAVSTSILLSNVGTVISLPSLAGYSETITLPANNAPAGTNLSLTISTKLPAGMPPIPSNFKLTQPFLFFTLLSPTNVTLQGFPAFSLELPAGLHWDGGPLHLGYYDPASGWKHIGNPTIAGSTLTFAGNRTPITLQANVKYAALPFACVTPLYFVADGNNGVGALTAYALTATGNVAPTRNISGAATGLGFPRRVNFDTSGNIYAANAPASGGHSITVYNPSANGNVAPTRTIAGAKSGLTGADGMVLDASGNVYIANCGVCFQSSGTPGVLEFAAGASGNVAPIRTISGTNTGFTDPTAVWLDGTGKIYVSDFANNRISIFAAAATGNVAPTAMIQGGTAAMSGPECVVLDATGNIYACNSTNNTITVYAPGTTGNTAPIRTLGGAATLLSSPTQLSFDTAGNMYVANPGSNTITVYAPGATGNQAPMLTVSGASTGLITPIGVAVQP